MDLILIKNYQFSLDDEIQNGFNFNQKLSILCSNFFSLISRVIGIIYHYQNRNKVFNDKKFSNNIKLNVFIQILPKKIEDEIIKKILYFYSCFIFKSPDNSLNFVLGELAQKIFSLDDEIQNGFNFNQKLSIIMFLNREQL